MNFPSGRGEISSEIDLSRTRIIFSSTSDFIIGRYGIIQSPVGLQIIFITGNTVIGLPQLNLFPGSVAGCIRRTMNPKSCSR